MIGNRSSQLVLLAVLVVAAATTYSLLSRRTPLPGSGQAAEIILSDTHERVPMEWSEVFKMKPRLSPGNGIWMVNYPPGTDKWACVVNKGAPDPTPANPG